MKILRTAVLPFLFIPQANPVQSDDTKENIPVASVSQTSEPNKDVQIKPIEFTQEGLKALDAMETFIEKYGPYSHGSKERFMGDRFKGGILADVGTIQREAAKKNLGFFARKAVKAYPYGNHADEVEAGVRKEAIPKMDSFLQEMGVDEKTANNITDFTGKKYVTEPILEKLGKNARIVKKEVERNLPDGQTVLFKGGFDLPLIKSLRKGELPSDVEIVNTKAKTKVAPEKK